MNLGTVLCEPNGSLHAIATASIRVDLDRVRIVLSNSSVMEVKRVTAKRFHKVMSHGRTRPCLISATNEKGETHEVVLKLSSANERGTQSAVSELICSIFASGLELPVPEPFLVSIPDGFDQIGLPEEVVRNFSNADGPQFGCAYKSGAIIAAPHRNVPTDKRKLAADILIFDVLIQNADRRIDKPNLLEHDDGYWLIDHDLALNFFGGMLIGGPVAPWDGKALNGNAFDFIKRHVLFQGLKGVKNLENAFARRMRRLTAPKVRNMLAAVPSEWWNEDGTRDEIESYLIEALKKSDKLVQFVNHHLEK